jgi:hypothetical protein
MLSILVVHKRVIKKLQESNKEVTRIRKLKNQECIRHLIDEQNKHPMVSTKRDNLAF